MCKGRSISKIVHLETWEECARVQKGRDHRRPAAAAGARVACTNPRGDLTAPPVHQLPCRENMRRYTAVRVPPDAEDAREENEPQEYAPLLYTSAKDGHEQIA
jgi:hypothetical protein